MNDPPVRPDGTCAYCGNDRRVRDSRKYAGKQALADPFCSTECCRDFHGVERRVLRERDAAL